MTRRKRVHLWRLKIRNIVVLRVVIVLLCELPGAVRMYDASPGWVMKHLIVCVRWITSTHRKTVRIYDNTAWRGGGGYCFPHRFEEILLISRQSRTPFQRVITPRCVWWVSGWWYGYDISRLIVVLNYCD